MKNLFKLVIFVFAALGFVACNNEPTSDQLKPTKSNPIIGKWVINPVDGDWVSEYFEFGADGIETTYKLRNGYAIYSEGNILVLEGGIWKEDVSVKYTFDESNQTIWIADVKAGTVEKISNNEFVLSNANTYLENGTYRRVNEFKEVDKLSFFGCSDYYKDGREPQIDYDKATVNGKKYDNQKEKCWCWTMKQTDMGVTTSTEEYRWETEFELVAACETAMYTFAQVYADLNAKASYTYINAPYYDSEECLENNDKY